MRTKSYKVLRWILRGLSGLIIIFFLLMFIGESLASMSANSVLQLSVMGIGLIGLGLAWKWELTGGIIALATYVGLAIINPATLQFPLLLLYPATAILYIVLWRIDRNKILKNE